MLRRRAFLGLHGRLAFLLILLPSFAGCSGGDFRVDADVWHAGYAWEYDETVRDQIRVDGEAPAGLDAEDQEQDQQENRTLRVEVFNSTANSVEGIPIYAAAVLVTTIPANASEPEDDGSEPTEAWSVWVYTADFNVVNPTYVDWRNQEVQLSGSEGGVAREGEAPANDTNNQPENEQRLLDWPLSKNKRWRHAERVADLEADGVFDGRVVGKASQTTPAGRFDVVRLSGTLAPLDTDTIAAAIRESLEGQGSEVDRLAFTYSVKYDYSYSDRVLNLVHYREVVQIRLSAEGEDADGADFDFTFTQTRTTERRLSTYQLDAGVEKPLTFALDVAQGLYAPKPITPATHLAVEILASTQGVNGAGDEKVTFGVRIYNSTAGEKKLRAPDADYPFVMASQAAPDYDHGYLEVVWGIDSVDRNNNLHEFKSVTADSLTLKSSDFPTQGWKQVRATLRLKDAQNTTDPTIFMDAVAFEVYYHANLTATRPAENVSGPDPRVGFPVQPSASRVTIKAAVEDLPPDLQCAVSGSSDCIQVIDASNRPVPDQRSNRMEFETTSLGSFQHGTWHATYRPSAPGNVVTFEVVVRYRTGA